jgi:hypothetical protein
MYQKEKVLTVYTARQLQPMPQIRVMKGWHRFAFSYPQPLHVEKLQLPMSLGAASGLSQEIQL